MIFRNDVNKYEEWRVRIFRFTLYLEAVHYRRTDMGGGSYIMTPDYFNEDIYCLKDENCDGFKCHEIIEELISSKNKALSYSNHEYSTIRKICELVLKGKRITICIDPEDQDIEEMFGI